MPEYVSPDEYIEELEIGAKPIEGVSTSTAGFVGMAQKGENDKPIMITSWGEFVNKFGMYDKDKAPYLSAAVSGFFVNGGKRCFVTKVKEGARDCDYIGTDGGHGNRTGLQSFIEIDDISVVCIPGMTSRAVQTAMITHCESLKDRFCILDPVRDADMDGIQSQKNDLVSEKGYGALYYPCIKVPVETLDNSGKVILVKEFMPPSGSMAGIFARSDYERGVHKAPANEVVRNVLELSFYITKKEQDVLNPRGINCIRAFPGRGIRVLGARTISNDSLWKYVNVRRLFLFLEESIDKGTQWAVFEPNDIHLWSRLKQLITQFLMNVWRSGALAGAKPEEAFFVKCDRSTMTQNDIDNGRLICMIGVAPVKPAEFIIFRIAQWTAGAKG